MVFNATFNNISAISWRSVFILIIHVPFGYRFNTLNDRLIKPLLRVISKGNTILNKTH
jgi:hypothetical protein